MFGVISKSDTCKVHSSQSNYCEVCKTIGLNYSHKARLFLNFDIVFFSELLEFLSNESVNLDIKKGKCFSLPNKEQNLPSYLTYSADINVLLGITKIKDNIIDRSASIWSSVKKSYKNEELKVRNRLGKFGLNMNKLEKLIKEHFLIENTSQNFQSIQESLEYYSKFISNLMEIIFSQGAIIVKKNNLSTEIGKFGSDFGKFVYLMDAINDYNIDCKKQEFNPIGMVQDIKDEALLISLKEYSDILFESMKQSLLSIGLTKKHYLFQKFESNIKTQTRHSLSKFATSLNIPFESLIEPIHDMSLNLLSFLKIEDCPCCWCEFAICKCCSNCCKN